MNMIDKRTTEANALRRTAWKIRQKKASERRPIANTEIDNAVDNVINEIIEELFAEANQLESQGDTK